MKTLAFTVAALCVGMLFSAALTMADRSRLGSKVDALTEQLAESDVERQSLVNAHKSQLADRERQASDLRQQLADVTEKLGRTEKNLADLQNARNREHQAVEAKRREQQKQDESTYRIGFGRSDFISSSIYKSPSRYEVTAKLLAESYLRKTFPTLAVMDVTTEPESVPKLPSELVSPWNATVYARVRDGSDARNIEIRIRVVEIGETETVFQASIKD